MRRTGNGLKLDLTEHTPGSSSSRLPNLVEHAESSTSQAITGVAGENLNSKLPNVVEGSMDYGNERRSSRYLDYDPKCFQDNQTAGGYIDSGGGGVNTNDFGYGDRSYSTRSYDRNLSDADYDRDNLDRFNNRIYTEESIRYDRAPDRSYQESDLDAPYERKEAQKLRIYNQDSQDIGRRYSRDLGNYEYTSRYAEETLKLEPKKDHCHLTDKIYEPVNKGYNSMGKGGYESGVKTRESSYELGTCGNSEIVGRLKYESKYDSSAKVYGTLPRYESSGKTYDSYDTAGRSYESKYDDTTYDSGTKGFQSSTSKYELSTSKSYIHERSKYEPVARYQDTSAKSYDQTLKISELGTTSSAYQRKQNPESAATSGSEKINGYKKNNFEAYGVYSDPEDDHGFISEKKTTPYTYKGVVVNATGESTVVDQKKTKDPQQTTVTSSPWCRPTILLLLLVLLVVIFVLIAGILLYFNCKYTMIFIR